MTPKRRPGGRAASEIGGRAARGSTSDPTAGLGQEDDGALFDAVVSSGAYRKVVTWVPIQEAERRRDAGMATSDENAGDFWRATCDQAIRHLASMRGRRWTVEDLRALGVPEPVSRNAWGARLAHAARTGVIKRVDYWPARRPEAHGRVLTVWQGR